MFKLDKNAEPKSIPDGSVDKDTTNFYHWDVLNAKTNTYLCKILPINLTNHSYTHLMPKITTTLLLLLCALGLKATAIHPPRDTSWRYPGDPVPERINPGFVTAIFGNEVNVRAKPSPNAPVLQTLPIGQLVRVVAVDTARLTLNGRTACWHWVDWTNAANETKQGWVWGGYLSLGVGMAGDDVFLLGCTQGKKTKNDARTINYTHEIKVVRDSRLLAKVNLPEVMLHESPIFSFAIDSSRGVTNVKNVVRFHWASATCGGMQQDVYALWTFNEALELLPPLTITGEAGAYTDLETYIFPDERDAVEYKYPLLYFYEKPENAGTILYLKEKSGGDENGADISIKINKMIFDGKNWKKPGVKN